MYSIAEERPYRSIPWYTASSLRANNATYKGRTCDSQLMRHIVHCFQVITKIAAEIDAELEGVRQKKREIEAEEVRLNAEFEGSRVK